MTLAHERPAEPTPVYDEDDHVGRTVWRVADRAWRDDVALELWVDATSPRGPVVIRLEGVLDETTGVHLLGVVGDLLAEGRLDLGFDTRRLRITPGGVAVMVGVSRRIHGAAGQMHWDGTAVA